MENRNFWDAWRRHWFFWVGVSAERPLEKNLPGRKIFTYYMGGRSGKNTGSSYHSIFWGFSDPPFPCILALPGGGSKNAIFWHFLRFFDIFRDFRGTPGYPPGGSKNAKKVKKRGLQTSADHFFWLFLRFFQKISKNCETCKKEKCCTGSVSVGSGVSGEN